MHYLSGQAGGSPLPGVEGEAAGWLAKGEDFLKRDNLKQAHSCYRRALALDAENPTLLMSYALLCLHLNRNQEIEAVQAGDEEAAQESDSVSPSSHAHG